MISAGEASNADHSHKSSPSGVPSSRSSRRRGRAGWDRVAAGRKHRLITLLIFLCTCVAYWERLAFNIAFTEIAENTNLTETDKGAVFAAFYYGYSVTPILGGFLANEYGGKAVLTLSFLLWAPASSLTALPVTIGRNLVVGVFACRVVIGLAQGMFLPAAHAVLGHWIPSKHRGRHFAFATSGMFAGAATAMVMVPALVANMGPTSVFHTAAAVAVVWLLLWLWAGSSGPPETPPPIAQCSLSNRRMRSDLCRPIPPGSTSISSPSSRPVLPPVRVPRSRQCSDTGLATVCGGNGTDPWAAVGITASSPGCFFFSNRDLYEQISREQGSVSSSTAHSNRLSPVDTPPTSGLLSRNDSARISAILQGHRFPRRSNPGAVGLKSSSTNAHTTGDERSTASGCQINQDSRGGDDDDDASHSTRSNPPLSVSSDAVVRRRYDGSSRAQSLRTSTAPATPSSTHTAPINRSKPTDIFYFSSGSSIAPTNESKVEPKILTTSGRRHGDAAGGRASSTASNESKCVESAPAAVGIRTLVGERLCGRSDITTATLSTEARTRESMDDGGGSKSYSEQRRNQGRRRAECRDGGAGRVTLAPAHSVNGRNAVSPRQGGRAAGGFSARGSTDKGSDDDGKNKSSFPWRAMCCSSAAWAVVAGNVGCSTGVAVVMSWQPTYFRELLEIDLENLGLVDQLFPYLTMLVFSVLGGMWYSWLVNKRGMSKSLASKLITGVGLSLALAAFLALRLATTAAAGTLLTSSALAALAISRGGWSNNHAEICGPEHGSMLYSVATCISSITSVVGISVTGKLLDAFGGASDPGAWTAAMGMVGGVCGFCGAFYVAAAGGDSVLFPATTSVDDGESSGGDGYGDAGDIEEIGVGDVRSIAGQQGNGDIWKKERSASEAFSISRGSDHREDFL